MYFLTLKYILVMDTNNWINNFNVWQVEAFYMYTIVVKNMHAQVELALNIFSLVK